MKIDDKFSIIAIYGIDIYQIYYQHLWFFYLTCLLNMIDDALGFRPVVRRNTGENSSQGLFY